MTGEDGLAPGLRAAKTTIVAAEHCTFHAGVPILSTPSVICLMEEVCVESTVGLLSEGNVTLGTHVDVSHEAPARFGEDVHVTAHLVAREGRRLEFDVEARHGDTVLGRGRHLRAVIDPSRSRA